MDDGAAIPLHTHPVDEAIVVTEGELTVQVGDETIVAEAESVVRIPPDVPHAIRNRGPDQARALAAAAWNRATWFKDATRYLEGKPGWTEPRARPSNSGSFRSGESAT
jgi:quercetin dioxygenase-like cupin family protein